MHFVHKRWPLTPRAVVWWHIGVFVTDSVWFFWQHFSIGYIFGIGLELVYSESSYRFIFCICLVLGMWWNTAVALCLCNIPPLALLLRSSAICPIQVHTLCPNTCTVHSLQADWSIVNAGWIINCPVTGVTHDGNRDDTWLKVVLSNDPLVRFTGDCRWVNMRSSTYEGTILSDGNIGANRWPISLLGWHWTRIHEQKNSKVSNG